MDGSIIIIIIVAIVYFLDSYSERKQQQYKQYLKTEAWQLQRYKALERDNYKCVICSTDKRVEVHHITYKRVGQENLSDLVCLCRKHHQLQHDHYGYNKKTLFFPIIKETT